MKKIYRIIFVTIITILQLSLIGVKNNQMDSREFFKIKNDAKAVSYLKKGKFVEETKDGYKLIDYNKVGFKQSEIFDKFYFKSRKTFEPIYEDRSVSFQYEEASNADQILMNYLLVVKGKKPVDSVDDLNVKLKKYERLLDYLEKGKYKSKINLTFKLIIVIVLSIWLTFFFDKRFEITGFFELLLIISFIENILITISPFKINVLILAILFVFRLIMFLAEDKLEEITNNYKSRSKIEDKFLEALN